MKIIGLDVGTVRIGVAKADSKVKIAVPAGVVPVDGEEFEAIARLARVYGTNCFVLGLPRNNEGAETKQTAYVRKFADGLRAKLPGSKIYFQDESLTSVVAKERLKSKKTPLKAQKKSGAVDSEAAVIILQDFLEHFVEKTGGKLPKEAKKNTSRAIERSKKPSHKIKIALGALAVVVALCGLTLGAVAIWYNNSLAPTSDCPDCITELKIEEGVSTAQIANRLESAGLVRSALAFQIYTKLNGLDGNYKSGDYQIPAGLTVAGIAERLVAGASSAKVFRLTILPGETIASIKKKLIDIGYDKAELDSAFAATYDHPVLATKPASQGLEGYIYGETYEFYVGESVRNIIIRTLDELYKVVTENELISAFSANGLTLYQGIVLASIVQKESRTPDMPNVARVFLNRLKIGMILGSDVTVAYALDQVDPDRLVYTSNAAGLKVEECHNTRLYAGLPCGPISNPGKQALLAVAHPADSSYLFFLTGDDSVMYYSTTEAGHNKNIRDHCRVLCATKL